MSNTKTPAEAALAIVSAMNAQIEAFKQQIEALDKAEKEAKVNTPLKKTELRPSRDVFKALAALKKAEPFINTGDPGNPAKQIKLVGKANDVTAAKDLPIEQKMEVAQKAAPDASKAPAKMVNPAPSPKGAVASPTPKPPTAPAPGAGMAKSTNCCGVFKKLKKGVK